MSPKSSSDRMSCIPHHWPVEVRSGEASAHSGSLGEASGVTRSALFPDIPNLGLGATPRVAARANLYVASIVQMRVPTLWSDGEGDVAVAWSGRAVVDPPG
jgi:hypothetical protein